MFNLPRDKAKLENLKSQFAPQKGQARKIWKVSVHRNKAKLQNFKSQFAPQ